MSISIICGTRGGGRGTEITNVVPIAPCIGETCSVKYRCVVIACLLFKRMPSTNSTWICSSVFLWGTLSNPSVHLSEFVRLSISVSCSITCSLRINFTPSPRAFSLTVRLIWTTKEIPTRTHAHIYIMQAVDDDCEILCFVCVYAYVCRFFIVSACVQKCGKWIRRKVRDIGLTVI